MVTRLHDPVHNRSEGTCLVLPMLDTNASGAIDAGDATHVVCPHRDTVPNVVYTIFDGASGEGLLTSTPRLASASVFTAGDIDSDGWNEYLILAWTGGVVEAIESDGTLIWTRTLPERNYGAAALSLADVDQDGLVDVVTGRSVLLGHGGSWLGTGSRGAHDWAGMSVSIAADLNPASPGLEVACGPTLYGSDGRTLWTAAGVPDGLTAVADLDLDGSPEIVVLSEAALHALGADGSVLGSGATDVPPRIFVAAPAVADLDGDLRPEVVVASEVAIAAFAWTGASFEKIWSTPVHVIGSQPIPTAFDFDCDGGAEIVYRDEDQWYVFDGRDGSILHQEPFPSGTIVEMPVVANVDDDPWAEIIVPSAGLEVRVLEVPGSATPRGIFNQPAYHVTNVLDSGAIPRVEPPHWLDANSQSAQAAADPADPCPAPCESVTPGAATARDLSACLAGMELRWDPAVFPSGSGTYSVHRADDAQGGTCAAALLLPPIATGLTTPRHVDEDTDPARAYAYVIVSEDAATAPAGCGPVGPGGGLVATSCLPGPLTDAGGARLPEGIGWTLRVGRDGPAARLHWGSARDLLPGEHVHVRRALAPLPGPWTQVAPEGLLARQHLDDPPGPLAFYDVRVANACEEESLPDDR